MGIDVCMCVCAKILIDILKNSLHKHPMKRKEKIKFESND